MKRKNIDIMKQFQDNKNLYEVFCHSIFSLLNNLLNAEEIRIHSINCRVKDENSLCKKLERKSGKYTDISHITDIVGLRIITYFNDDVNKIAQLINDEFIIDKDNSIDKRSSIEPNEFGYLSLHLVVELNKQRKELTEYKLFSNMKAEIQIRTILQHAWAEIEHDLGYKSSIQVPREIRRSFSRVAGILETADNEFISIKNELSKYENEVLQKIEQETEKVYIDKLSLTAFMRTSTILNDLDKRIIEHCRCILKDDDHFINSLLSYLQYCGINTIKKLDTLLEENENFIYYLSSKILDRSYKDLSKGISIFYLVYCYLLKNKGKSGVSEYLSKFGFNTYSIDLDYDSEFEFDINDDSVEYDDDVAVTEDMIEFDDTDPYIEDDGFADKLENLYKDFLANGGEQFDSPTS